LIHQLRSKTKDFLIIFKIMVLFNYIFIYFILSFGLIESKNEKSGLNPDRKSTTKVEGSSREETTESFHSHACREYSIEPGLAQPVEYKIVINEIMADPTPVAGLPDREYIELFNAGITAVSLKNWILGMGSKQKYFPDVTIAASGYLLVTAPGGAKDLQTYGRVVEISGFVINNDGLALSLADPEKRWIDQVGYTPSLHKKGFGEGGYSLERIDPERYCGQNNNWTTTLSGKGGTPGTENSVKAANPDHIPPQLLATNFADHSRLEIQLSESVLLPAVYTDMLRNIPPGVVVDSVKMDQSTFVIQVFFRPASISNGVNYWLELHGLKDECGNVMVDQVVKFGYYLPVKQDLLISEVLFNPYPEGSDFVEIYNNSRHEVDLSGLYLATRDVAKTVRQISQLSLNQQYLSAGSYLAATKSREGILRFYRTKCQACLLETEKFPTLADQSGSVVLLNQNQEVIDEMEYSDGMHHPFIADKEGISLERISFLKPASRKDNWHSASKNSGFATPGYQNSVSETADSTGKWVTVDPVIFSPNGDGMNDYLNIYLNTDEPGWILNITILNCAGRMVRNLANNFTTGSSDQVVWDGLSDDYQKVQPGIYVLNILLFGKTGKHRSMKLACVVTDRL